MPQLPQLPQVFRVRQTFDAPRLVDVAAAVEEQLAGLRLETVVRPGQSVAITAGSRGIAQIATILRVAVAHFQRLGARPFLVPAMGSHGGGTAAGQLHILESYGITAAAVGCPIRSQMDTAIVCRAAEGFDVHCDRLALAADHILVCNRIKPHTSIAGPIESGLMKMLLIGLGKRAGAEVLHRAIAAHGFQQVVGSVTPEMLARCRVVAGLAVVENAQHQTALVEAIRPQDFFTREKQLLTLARQWLARLPFRQVDLLVIDQIGKDLSGLGFDVNVTGRKFYDHQAAPDEYPKVKRIALRRLSPHSQGNAMGMGSAEFCRTQLLQATDVAATRMNAMSSGRVAAAMCPLDYATDREMIEAALATLALGQPGAARLLWIADTMHLDEVECSAAYLEEARGRPDLEVLGALRPLPLDAAGNLPDW